jgi:hypothetical protein
VVWTSCSLLVEAASWRGSALLCAASRLSTVANSWRNSASFFLAEACGVFLGREYLRTRMIQAISNQPTTINNILTSVFEKANSLIWSYKNLEVHSVLNIKGFSVETPTLMKTKGILDEYRLSKLLFFASALCHCFFCATEVITGAPTLQILQTKTGGLGRVKIQ